MKLPFEGLDLFHKDIQKKAKLMLIVKRHLAQENKDFITYSKLATHS